YAQQIQAERGAGCLAGIRPQADRLIIKRRHHAQRFQVVEQAGHGLRVHGALMGNGGRRDMLLGIAGHLVAKAVEFFLAESHCAPDQEGVALDYGRPAAWHECWRRLKILYFRPSGPITRGRRPWRAPPTCATPAAFGCWSSSASATDSRRHS